MIQLDSDLVRLWVSARSLPATLRRVTRISSLRGDEGETHTVPTLAVGMAGVVRIERPHARPLDLAAGEAALIAPGARHRHVPLKAGSAGYFQGFMLGRSDIELAMNGRTWSLVIPESPSRSLLERACLPVTGESQRLALVREALKMPEPGGAQVVAPMPAAVKRMWLFLRQKRLSPIGAAAVLHASGLGATRAHLLFRTYFGETPHRLLNRHRLEYACHLLACGEAVATVAAACGFRSRLHFTAAFRAVHHLSPRQWRARIAGRHRAHAEDDAEQQRGQGHGLASSSGTAQPASQPRLSS